MKQRALFGASGAPAAKLLGWFLAGYSIILAGRAWLSRPPEPPAPAAAAAGPEIRTLRLALSTSQAQNRALRGEIDGLLASGVARRRVVRPPGAAAAAGSNRSAEVLGDRIRDALTDLDDEDDEDSDARAASALVGALRLGRRGFEPLREAYLSAEDSSTKTKILPSLVFIGGGAARDFVLAELRSAKDPELRKALLNASVRYATPDHVAEVQDIYLRALSAPDADPESRMSALRGLRYAEGDEVESALVAAASSDSEDVRLVAIRSLAARPALRDRLREVLEGEPMERLREVGRCEAVLAETER